MKTHSLKLYDRIRASPLYESGALERLFRNARTSSGVTSYELLASSAPSDRPLMVVDLAAGSGALSALLLTKLHPRSTITAIDYDLGEFNQALKLSASVTSLECLIPDIPLPANCADFIFCHCGIMFFTPLEQAIQEICRVLKPGGELVLNILGEARGAFEREYEALAGQYERRVAGFVGWGDERAQSLDSLQGVIKNCDLQIVESLEYEISVFSDAGPLEQMLRPFYQISYLLSANEESELTERQKALIESYKAASFRIALIKMSAKKAV